MNIKLVFTFLLAICFYSIGSAQLEKTIHQSFELDEINTVGIQLTGESVLETWAGNTILTETTVTLYDASPNIFKHFVNKGRYEIGSILKDDTIILTSKDQDRTAIRTVDRECIETVLIKIYVPEDFNISDPTLLSRKLDIPTNTNNN